jgi:hypothetical protein
VTSGSAIEGRDVRQGAERVARSRWIEWLGRAGLVAQGFSYALVGVLAIAVVAGERGQAAGREDALETLAGKPGGAIVLALVAFGFAGYAAWRLAQAIFDRGGKGDDAKGLAKRAGYAGKAVLYGGLTVVTISILLGGESGGSGGSSAQEEQATAGVLGWPGGRWLVLGAALAIGGTALFQVYRAVSGGFMKDIDTSEMSDVERRWTHRLGVVGLLARAVVFGVVAWFLLKAAVEYDPEETAGLGEALGTLANAAYGPVLLGLTAAGLVAFGIFCVAQSRYRQV